MPARYINEARGPGAQEKRQKLEQLRSVSRDTRQKIRRRESRGTIGRARARAKKAAREHKLGRTNFGNVLELLSPRIQREKHQRRFTSGPRALYRPRKKSARARPNFRRPFGSRCAPRANKVGR